MERLSTQKMACLASLFLLSACSAVGPQEDPLKRKATWFSYLSGADIKAHCTVGAKNYYRFIYNGVYTEQVRSYDFQVNENNIFMLTHITGDPYLNSQGPAWGINIGNLWEGVADKRSLPVEEERNLRLALKLSGYDQATERPVALISSEFYWVVQSCEEGQYRFKAWRAYGNEEAFKTLDFPKTLQGFDRTQVKFNPWRSLPPENHAPYSPVWERNQPFVLLAGASGINYHSLDDLFY